MLMFPSESPYRIDQVMSSPWLMTLLFVSQLLLASCISWSAARQKMSWWWIAVGLFCLTTTVFFTLSSWGTSDVTKLNHYIDQLAERLPAEPFWWIAAPLIKSLPYRMAAIHGLVATFFAAWAIFLSRCWQLPGWGGWWALLLLTSPFLRGFLQNAHTRQAWALLLVVPLFLRVSGFLEIRILPVFSSAALALFSHLTALPMLALAVMPGIWQGTAFFVRLPRFVKTGVFALLVAAFSILAQPILHKLLDYASQMNFFSAYSIRRTVLVSQVLLLVPFCFTCQRRQLTWTALKDCRVSRAVLLFSILFCFVQLGVRFEIYPQIAFRFADPIGLFLLLSAFRWFQLYDSQRMLIPLLVFSLLSWSKQLVDPVGLDCRLDDTFLCIPDRWPWQISY
ncbi:hypothetical protein [Prochlorococcus marinus]|uniref:hypothetical protein n=1 Tax=Prochlorococcus marinus TaxID=1219 RepID=UPI0012DA100A|nr:hypothetical protein [Prochlorococcus marinus]